MDKLYVFHHRLVSKTNTKFTRYLKDQVNRESQLIGIKGARGVGKSTLLLQHIKANFAKGDQALYISMDSLAVKPCTLFEIAEHHHNRGGTHLFIDEIHKYVDWSRELKSLYDLYPELRLVFSGSSILQVYNSFGDLSRRAITYDLPGLSFREFVNLETSSSFEPLQLKDILTNHVELAEEMVKHIKVLAYFENYLRYGYYPFYLQSIKDYHLKLENVINTILDVDLPFMLEINVHNIFKLKKLLYILSTSVPFMPNISKLAGSLELNRNTLYNYLYYLSEAKLISLLLDSGKSYSTLAKPEKIYIQNPNLCYTLNNESPNKGSLREAFFFNQLSTTEKINYSSNGDFLVNDNLTFEVGGSGKDYSQNSTIENSFLALDNIQIGVRNKIPLWMFGFLY
jgi:uncharacterized protein